MIPMIQISVGRCKSPRCRSRHVTVFSLDMISRI